MIGSPFALEAVPPPTLAQRLLGRRHPANALLELRTALAEADSPLDVPVEEVDALVDRFGFDVRRRFRPELLDLYRSYLIHCLRDRHLSERETGELRHLADLFGLSVANCDLIVRKVAREVYLRSVDEVLEDGAVDADERRFLGRLRAHLKIPDDVAENIEEVRGRQLRNRRDRRGS